MNWLSTRVVTPGVATAATFAQASVTNTLSLLLQSAEVALRGRNTSGCWIGSIEFPVTGGPAKLSVTARGFHEQPDGAQTSIYVVIGAVLKSFAFDNAQTGDFTETYEATISGEPKQTITIIILAEKPAAAGEVLIGLDSLDIVTVNP
ncbi:MAG TPA: hypothetical protein VKB93_22945 [Thermoanaerobaculia bacterium]|nr:hypothetical protein [Thermoanaerobaculia bacterium]